MLHSQLFSEAVRRMLGPPERGALAFIRCLPPMVVEQLATDLEFQPGDWLVYRVADEPDEERQRTITADRAVELREAKGPATLLLVDPERAGAGMDGIYSAARELDETALFREALSCAGRAVTKGWSREVRERAEQALKKARLRSHFVRISPWREFDFLVRIASGEARPGAFLYLLGLWPVAEDEAEAEDWNRALDISRMLVGRLLAERGAASLYRRVDSVKLADVSVKLRPELERFLREVEGLPLLDALARLAERSELWLYRLRISDLAGRIESIELVPWRTSSGRIVKWSGLREGVSPQEPPQLILDPRARETRRYSKLEVRWKSTPTTLDEGAVEYRVTIVSDQGDELAARVVPHRSRAQLQKCTFTNDDFGDLGEDTVLSARAQVEVVGNPTIEPEETEEFIVCTGEPEMQNAASGARRMRTFSEALVELGSWPAVSALVGGISPARPLATDRKSHIVLRSAERGKAFRVFRPPLLAAVEQDWSAQGGAVGRWVVKVRDTGSVVGNVEFVPVEKPATISEPVWERLANASRRLAERFAAFSGGAGQVYDQEAPGFEHVKEYLLAWTAALQTAEPTLALAHTLEVQNASGRTIGLLVLPSHPLRVAWHVAYDNLVFHAAFEERVPPQQLRDEFRLLDGALFPAFLPGIARGSTFVFADTLGFHVVGMVYDSDREPKAAVATMAKALSGEASEGLAPTVGSQSAEVLAEEIRKYLRCHTDEESSLAEPVRVLQVHALRAGDGLTVARALGAAATEGSTVEEEEATEGTGSKLAFALELYSAAEQRTLAGRFLAEVQAKRRKGAGVVAQEDRWIIESVPLPHGVAMPRLRWARREGQRPSAPAHLALAFDTFGSRVLAEPAANAPAGKALAAYGLLAGWDRVYTGRPAPMWRSFANVASEGEKHPADRTHTERLLRLQQLVLRCVANHLGATTDEVPVLRNEIAPEDAETLKELHRLCDWVITLDRNAGIEYFDSPREHPDIYDAYVIDCVPEREDLGCLQLVTSTANFAEVRELLDDVLALMGLPRSRRNAQFLLEQLKALSGRLAIQFTGQRPPNPDVAALALVYAYCREPSQRPASWPSLETGFFVPVRDVAELLPPVEESLAQEGQGRSDLLYVTTVPRKGLALQWVRVAYRRHLRTARAAEFRLQLVREVETLQQRWEAWIQERQLPPSLMALRRARFMRVLRFYLERARRHHLGPDCYRSLVEELQKMIERGASYSLWSRRPLVFICCPEYDSHQPLLLETDGAEVFVFGASLLPDRLSEALGEQSERGEHDDGVYGARWRDAQAPFVYPPSEPREDTPELECADRPGGEEPYKVIARAAETSADGPTIVLGKRLLSDEAVVWRMATRGNPHLLVAGLPGMGKTTSLVNLCIHMSMAGVRPVVFSYHQDIDERLRQFLPDVRFLDFGDIGFNPLEISNRDNPTAYLDVAGVMRDIFLAIFPELRELQGERIRQAIKQSFVELGWADPGADRSKLEVPPFRRFFEILRSDPRPDRSLHGLNMRLQELADYGLFEVRAQAESLWEVNTPIVLCIHRTQNERLQRAFASLVFYWLYKDMFRRGVQERITHAIVFDEAHRAARLRLIPTMAKECRKYGISLVLASQEARDFHPSLFSAIANYLVLRLNEPDAKALVRNVAPAHQERMLTDKIKQLERFQAFYFSEGSSRPAPLRLFDLEELAAIERQR